MGNAAIGNIEFYAGYRGGETPRSVTVAGIRRAKEPFRFQVVVTDIFDARAWRGADDAVAYITTRYVAALEQLVRGDPTQYLWAHARWELEPAGRPADPPADTPR